MIKTDKESAMQVSSDEIAWALAVKQAARKDSRIDDLQISDLEYVQHAIIAKDKTAKALKRIRRLQAFKETYGIFQDGSYEQGIREFHHFCTMFPGFYLGLGIKDGVCLVCYDFSKYTVSRLNTKEFYSMSLRAFFYVLQSVNCDFDSVRKGSMGILDFSQAGPQNFSMEQEKRTASLFSDSYPLRTHMIAIVGANVFIRLFFNTLKMFLPRKVARAYQFPANRHEFLYASSAHVPAQYFPEPWGGTQTLDQVKEEFSNRLQRRYKNAQEFRLPPDEQSLDCSNVVLPAQPDKQDNLCRNVTSSTDSSLGTEPVPLG